MTSEELLAAARAGDRVRNEHSLHEAHKPDLERTKCPGWTHAWRTLVCIDGEDVVECYNCGKQDIVRCNFDEEYS